MFLQVALLFLLMQSSGNGSTLFQLESSADGGERPKKNPILSSPVLDDEVFRQFEVPPEGMDHVEGDHRPQWKQLIPVRIIISSTCGFHLIIFCCLHELFLCNNTLVFFVVSCKFWFFGKIELLSQSRFLESMR